MEHFRYFRKSSCFAQQSQRRILRARDGTVCDAKNNCESMNIISMNHGSITEDESDHQSCEHFLNSSEN